MLILICPAAWAAEDSADISTESAGPTSRIVGGKEAEKGAWPWMAAIVDADSTSNYDGQFCGAELIHPQWAITAAHCVDGELPQNIAVALGLHNLETDTGERVGVKRIIVHPDYNDRTDDVDIALLELDRSVEYETLSLYTGTDSLSGKTAVTIGWGSTDPVFKSYPEELRQVSVPVVSNTTCNAAFNAYASYYDDPITDNMMCAGFEEGGKDACQGDSGGPLIVAEDGQWQLAGVVSWGEGCAEPGIYGVYTRVSRFADFVAQYVPPAGDLNGNGYVGLEDVIGILRIVAEIRPRTTSATNCGDFDSDGDLTLADGIGILKLLTMP
ncbi:trypsin-like serine protease [Desulfonema ishimotonii]|nr:trypsin-like serine protease [Desulfonema ishimotonii]